MDSDLHVFRGVDLHGDVHEVELTRDQAVQLAGGSLAYFARDEQVAMNEAGRVVYRESAAPQLPDAA